MSRSRRRDKFGSQSESCAGRPEWSPLQRTLADRPLSPGERAEGAATGGLNISYPRQGLGYSATRPKQQTSSLPSLVSLPLVSLPFPPAHSEETRRSWLRAGPKESTHTLRSRAFLQSFPATLLSSPESLCDPFNALITPPVNREPTTPNLRTSAPQCADRPGLQFPCSDHGGSSHSEADWPLQAGKEIGVGKAHWFEPPLPPNRTCGSPASGSPVSGVHGGTDRSARGLRPW